MSRATALPYGTDQLIDPAMAHSLHVDACRNHAAIAWVVLWDLPAYPERCSAAGDKRISAVAVSAAGRYPGRHSGDAAAGGGAVRADAGGSARGGGDLVRWAVTGGVSLLESTSSKEEDHNCGPAEPKQSIKYKINNVHSRICHGVCCMLGHPAQA